ncbi:hypothetical protein Emed_004425 [Eimeria media]
MMTVPDATIPKEGTLRFTQPKVSATGATLQGYFGTGWIQRSRSPYEAPLMVVPRKGDPARSRSSRRLVNYRPLNAVTTEDHGMYPKLVTCKLAAQPREYPQYRVGADGAHPSTKIAFWPTGIANDTQVRQFLRNVYYRRTFVYTEFAALARALHQLLKDKASFQWTAAHSCPVQALENRQSHYTKLSLLDPIKPFNPRTDASSVVIGALVEHESKPLGLRSKRLDNAEMQYSTGDQEVLAVVGALERWRHLLVKREVAVYTYRKALQYRARLRCYRARRGRIARWLDFLAALRHPKILYQRGPTKVVADASSRWPPQAQDPQHSSCNALSASLSERTAIRSHAFPTAVNHSSCFKLLFFL